MDTRKEILDKLLSSHRDLRRVEQKIGVDREELIGAQARFEISVEFLLLHNNWLKIEEVL